MTISSLNTTLVAGSLFMLAAVSVQPVRAEDTRRIDYLSFAQGAVPIRIDGATKALGVGMDQALQVIDGNSGGFGLTPKPGAKDFNLSFVYELPVETTFDTFAVPNILETPSPFQTFVKSIRISGSDMAADGPFHELGSAILTTHAKKGELTAFPAAAMRPVRWVRVTLDGGINIEREKTFFEFSEVIGYGSQEQAPLSNGFTGKWKGRGVKLELHQEGVRVSGCYDGEGDLNGTVTGNLLRATGKSRNTAVPSTFVLSVGKDNEIFGVRSTNGAPFRLYKGDAAPTSRTECSEQSVEPIGCGSIIHGINFDFDSAAIRADSVGVLDALYDGLNSATASSITLIGHTSSEGSDDYNDALSQRRAEAVVAAIVKRGIQISRFSAVGLGEKHPIADNATEAGRVLNRRVEIECH